MIHYFMFLLKCLVVLVFFHDLSPGLEKLSVRSVKCVFLGYSRLQKGYKCYSPTIKQYYMSTDVTFFEDTPFFSPSVDYPSSLQKVLPIPSSCPLGNLDQNVNVVHLLHQIHLKLLLHLLLHINAGQGKLDL